MENEFLHYPRRRLALSLTNSGNEVPAVEGPVRIVGFHLTNADAAAAQIVFQYFNGAQSYFTHNVPADIESRYIHMPFYAEGGLSVIMDGTSEGADLVLFMVGRDLTE